ncbi:iron-sulfur cluster insertion protein ErpA [Pinisolibacter aquiterrae]|uniref:iron-sulfur cluster insertion protein ErpA n=1 Tax=Pinisolibacter aquiterrae TaxID=2815579 RepID=UPI001E2BEC67|nr:iron-sulfur cluster insertion protein ErpA [Pinisolibacter aquiterrae]MBV5264991.1 iron-sulfur cluster insertion protein ErpA [Pinisolibacter aquiterrae]MCC8235627.1 iron-sulfur cluster insertion protein ErpA [Pinisolibacter aquiterrae]
MTDTAPPIAVTAAAAARIRYVVSDEPTGTVMRISVKGGGCSGFSYGFELTTAREDDDIVIERDGATVVIDPVSAEYLTGSELDFVDDLMGQAFKMKNPQATATCGCGTSFAM